MRAQRALLIPADDPTATFILVQLANGTTRPLSLECIRRSSILLTALDTAGGHGTGEVFCNFLEEWMLFDSLSPRSRGRQADEGLVKAAEAANYLADAEILQEAAVLLSWRVLAADMPKHRVSQILGSLSQDVMRLVLRAKTLPLSFLLSHLPTPYHSDALRTCFPSAESSNSLEFLGWQWTADTTVSAMHALPALTTVTTLKVAIRADLNRRARSELSSSVLRAVASMPALKALTLSELCVSNRSAAEDLLDESAGGHLQLQTLLFFNCGVSTNVRNILADVIQSMPTLISLEFNASREHELFRGLVSSITPPLLSLTNLESIQISGQNLSQEEVEHIAVCLGSLHEAPLQMLSLPFNSIRAGGAQALATSLSVLTNLEKLDLTKNTVAATGAEAISEALPKCSQLTLIDFWANAISDIGAHALARSLNRLLSLEVLDLCLNRIGDSGAIALAGALGNLTGLRSCNLDKNLVGDEGALALARSLTGLQSFGTLFLCRNRLSDEGKFAVEEILQSAVRVQSLAARMEQHLTETM